MRDVPTGIDDFAVVRNEDYYYVDKTVLLKELRPGKVSLFTRPRRFGKSLNMSMLKNFYEVNSDKTLFDGLLIAEDREFCDKNMGKYPVVSISLKSVNGPNFTEAKNAISAVIATEAMRFDFLAGSSRLNEEEKSLYRQLIKVDTEGGRRFDISYDALVGSLFTLTSLLAKHYSSKVVILIDEYDVPLDKAHLNGYYDQMVMLIRDMFEAGLKSNTNLALAALTGCLKISKESIFTGLNNLDTYSITDSECDDYFGFTDDDVDKILVYYNLRGKFLFIFLLRYGIIINIRCLQERQGGGYNAFYKSCYYGLQP